MFDTIIISEEPIMFDAIIISDLHLSAHNCQTALILKFLTKIETRETLTKRLIIAGDLFDSFNSRLRKEEWKILSLLRKISKDVELVWVKGNHDAYSSASPVSHIIGSNFYPMHYVFDSGDKKIIVIHGDIFDDFLTDHPILTWACDWIYYLFQKIDRSHFVARVAKQNSKKYLHCTEIVENQAILYAQKNKCDIAVCGHSHFAIGKENYFNSGCWTEKPCSYILVNGNELKLEFYSDV